MNHSDLNQLTAHLFRENSGKMVAVLSRMLGLARIELVMDVVQDTFETALTRWRFSGVPENPSGWLMQVARNKALNASKRESRMESFSAETYSPFYEEGFEPEFDPLLSAAETEDSQLRLLLICCHPNFTAKNQIIITLNILCGFGLPEIANALLMKEEAVKKALSRGKSVLRTLDHIMREPVLNASPQQIRTVLLILYLMFNEGYKTTRGKEAIKHDLCYEAIRLARLLERSEGLMKEEIRALLALLFFNLSRFPARRNANDEWLTLAEQDRSLWNRVFIEEGYHYLKLATNSTTMTRFHLEAIISSLHCAAASLEETDWKKIAWLYRQLEKLEPGSPIVRLNRIIAESYVSNSESLMRDLDEMGKESGFRHDYLLAAARGDLYQRRGEVMAARQAYELAHRLALSPADRHLLEKKIARCRE